MSKSHTVPPLIAAAEALNGSLEAFAKAAHELSKIELDSRRGVERATEVIGRFPEIDELLGAHLGRLVSVIGEVRDGQQTSATAVQERAQLVLERKTVLLELLERLNGLGQDVARLAELLEGRTDADARTRVEEALGRIAELSEMAQGFALDAQAKGFADVAADAHALRQQLLSVKNKAGLLAAKLAPSS